MPVGSLPIAVWLCADLGFTSHANSYGLLLSFPEEHTHVLELINDVGRNFEDAESFPYGDRSTSFPFADDKVAIALLKRLMSTFLGEDSISFTEWNGESTLPEPDVHNDYVAAPQHYNFTRYVSPHLHPLHTHGKHYKPLLHDSIPLEPISLAFSPYHASPEPFYSRTYMRYKNIYAKREYKCVMEVGWDPETDINQGFHLSTRFSYKLPKGHNTSISSNLHYKASSSTSLVSLQVHLNA